MFATPFHPVSMRHGGLEYQLPLVSKSRRPEHQGPSPLLYDEGPLLALELGVAVTSSSLETMSQHLADFVWDVYVKGLVEKKVEEIKTIPEAHSPVVAIFLVVVDGMPRVVQ